MLVVGLIPDSEIRRCKGPPVMNEAERFTMVNSVKWVDEVLTGADASGNLMSRAVCPITQLGAARRCFT